MNQKEPICTECCTIPKGWGSELILINDEEYCGKILRFNQGCSFSMHYHIKKKETWYVQTGEFLFSWIDTEKGEKITRNLMRGDVVTIPRGMPHQLYAKTEGEIIEVSTQHFDSDSYRIYKGN